MCVCRVSSVRTFSSSCVYMWWVVGDVKCFWNIFLSTRMDEAQAARGQKVQLSRKEVVGGSACPGSQRPAALLPCDKEARSAWQHSGWLVQLSMLWSQKRWGYHIWRGKKISISCPTIMARGNYHEADRVQQNKFLCILKVNLKRIKLCFLLWGCLEILSFWGAFWIVK